MSTSTPPRKRWTVSHPEVALDETIDIATAGEARRVAWQRWHAHQAALRSTGGDGGRDTPQPAASKPTSTTSPWTAT